MARCLCTRTSCFCEDPSSSTVVSAMSCCLMDIFTSVPFRPSANTLRTFYNMLLCVCSLVLRGVFDIISNSQTIFIEEKNISTEDG